MVGPRLIQQPTQMTLTAEKNTTVYASDAHIAVPIKCPPWRLATPAVCKTSVPLVSVVVAGQAEVNRVDEGRGAALCLVEVSHLLSLRKKDRNRRKPSGKHIRWRREKAKISK